MKANRTLTHCSTPANLSVLLLTRALAFRVLLLRVAVLVLKCTPLVIKPNVSWFLTWFLILKNIYEGWGRKQTHARQVLFFHAFGRTASPKSSAPSKTKTDKTAQAKQRRVVLQKQDSCDLVSQVKGIIVAQHVMRRPLRICLAFDTCFSHSCLAFEGGCLCFEMDTSRDKA